MAIAVKHLDPIPKPRKRRLSTSRTSTTVSLAILLLTCFVYLAHHPVHLTQLPHIAPNVTQSRLDAELNAFGSSDARVKRADEAVRQRLLLASPPPLHRNGACLPHIVYDAPPHEGAEEIARAIQQYQKRQGRSAVLCKHPWCRKRVGEICGGLRNVTSLIGRMPGREGLLDCLRERGFYVVTSVVKPRAGGSEIERRGPRCGMLNFYDGKGVDCGGWKRVEERVGGIVGRFDEVLEIGVGGVVGGGVLGARIEGFLKEGVVGGGEVGDGRLKAEMFLYRELRKVTGRRDRRLC